MREAQVWALLWNIQPWLLVLQDGGAYDDSQTCMDDGLLVWDSGIARVRTIGVAHTGIP
jgi:hypothetical protein